MIRFMAKHPVLGGMALMLVHLALWAATVAVIDVTGSERIDRGLTRSYWVATPLLAAAIGLWLTLLRRRSGLSAWPICWLTFVLAGQVWAHQAVVRLVSTLSQRGSAEFKVEAADPAHYAGWLSFPGTLMPTVGLPLGVLVGLAAAWYLLRTGRWHHVVPAATATAARPSAPFLVRCPAVAAALLTAPGLQYAWLLLVPPLVGSSGDAIRAAALAYLALGVLTAFAAGLAIAYSRRRAGMPLGWMAALVPTVVVAAMVACVTAASWMRGMLYDPPRLGVGFFRGPFTSYDAARPVFVAALAASAAGCLLGILAGARLGRRASGAAERQATGIVPGPEDGP